MTDVDRVLGAVLCGGASRRMGRPKPGVPWEGVPMAVRVGASLRAGGCADVFAVGGDPTVVEPLGLVLVADERPGEGPLPAVVTALRHAAGCRALVVSCDVPRLGEGSVRRLLAASSRGGDVTIATTDRIEPLCAVWHPAALGRLESAVRGGERSIRRVVRDLSVHLLPVAAGELANVNTPDDLAD